MKNRRHRHLTAVEVDSEGSWAISYGDMVTLLLTFFILFFTVDKFRLQKTLKLDLLARQEKMSENIAQNLSTEFLSTEKLMKDLQGKVHQSGQKVIVEFSGISFFRSGQIDLNPAAQKALSKFYEVYSPHMGHYNLSIRAFTDSRKVRADQRRYKDNLELSALRSVSVMRFFQRTGVPLNNMKLSGYGELIFTENDLKSMPLSDRRPSSLHDLARTAVLIIEPKEEK